MGTQSLIDALDRCERALLRIERSASRPAPAAPIAPAREDALRAQVAAAIRELDDILAQASPGQVDG